MAAAHASPQRSRELKELRGGGLGLAVKRQRRLSYGPLGPTRRFLPSGLRPVDHGDYRAQDTPVIVCGHDVDDIGTLVQSYGGREETQGIDRDTHTFNRDDGVRASSAREADGALRYNALVPWLGNDEYEGLGRRDQGYDCQEDALSVSGLIDSDYFDGIVPGGQRDLRPELSVRGHVYDRPVDCDRGAWASAAVDYDGIAGNGAPVGGTAHIQTQRRYWRRGGRRHGRGGRTG